MDTPDPQQALTPVGPPGRRDRKAKAYHAEIHRLRAAGYTFDAIRLSLLHTGVQVSVATVKREAAKPSPATICSVPGSTRRGPPIDQAPSDRSMSHSLSAASGSVPPSRAPASFVGDTRTGKQIAEEFVKGRITNPLLQERMRHEDRRD